jgi:hypothetical protein
MRSMNFGAAITTVDTTHSSSPNFRHFHCCNLHDEDQSAVACCHRPPASISLQETTTLPTVPNTRQNLKNTRQRLHSAKGIRHKKTRQRVLCRVHFVGHSAKTLPSAQSRTWQRGRNGNGRFAECRNSGTRQRRQI